MPISHGGETRATAACGSALAHVYSTNVSTYYYLVMTKYCTSMMRLQPARGEKTVDDSNQGHLHPSWQYQVLIQRMGRGASADSSQARGGATQSTTRNGGARAQQAPSGTLVP
jgi:hypothetical protein